jgi:hypothetical protein
MKDFCKKWFIEWPLLTALNRLLKVNHRHKKNVETWKKKAYFLYNKLSNSELYYRKQLEERDAKIKTLRKETADLRRKLNEKRDNESMVINSNDRPGLSIYS